MMLNLEISVMIFSKICAVFGKDILKRFTRVISYNVLIIPHSIWMLTVLLKL